MRRNRANVRRDRTNLTLFVLVALVIVCGGSFLAVRTMNNKTTVASPIVTTLTDAGTSATTNQFTFPTTTTAPITNEAIPTVPIATTRDLSDLTVGTVKANDDDETTTRNPFTTFANGSKSDDDETTKSKTTTTTKPTTTQKTTDPATTAEAEEMIERAAVFSDGFLGFLYNPDGNYYYTADDPWQRNFGFNQLYDTGAPFLVFYYDTFRCKFNYNKKDWMIQFWKGQYGFVFLGAEVGVYNKPEDREREHYDCADDNDKLMMSMTFYRKGEELLSRQYASYWWCTGFVPGKLDQFSDRSELSMRVRITMKDYKMLLSFCAAMKDNGFTLNKDFTTSGLDVYITW
ncbi:MAG: DUF4474 domain-containing protein [Faecalibacterium sp.]|nr:DUF4474 domain-containing protein [Ruminococcus sp.]MCM1393215.1 DUF4474 domain-containing protein [Ruminococcus sp.]MCM1486382.1 DUF4474 domain-containing protein [Faecalibacterium sp.]